MGDWAFRALHASLRAHLKPLAGYTVPLVEWGVAECLRPRAPPIYGRSGSRTLAPLGATHVPIFARSHGANADVNLQRATFAVRVCLVVNVQLLPFAFRRVGEILPVRSCPLDTKHITRNSGCVRKKFFEIFYSLLPRIEKIALTPPIP